MQAWTWPGTSERPGGDGAGAAAPPRHGAAQARPVGGRLGRLGRLVHAGCALPALLHGVRYLRGETGFDPLNALIHATGFWALALLLATLAVTPFRRASVWVARAVAVRHGRRVSDWNCLVRQRRALGLWSFFYATLHVALHGVLEAGSLAELWREAIERRYMLLGLGAFVLLVPLAVTSTQGWIRRLKRHWARLHLLVYPAAALAVAHTWWQTKHGQELPWGFVAMAVALLAARALAWWAGDRQRAAEWPARDSAPGRH